MTVASIICKGCGIELIGATQVKRLMEHGELCNSCRAFPTGYERVTRRDEVCTYCGKETWEH